MINEAVRGRGDARLAAYLTDIGDNDLVVELPARGVVAGQFASQLREIVARCAHGRTARPILHLCVSPAVPWSDAQYQRYLDLYEAEFDLADQPRLAVHHSKKGRDHRHYVYSVVKRDGRAVDLRNDYARREKIARVVEFEFGERHVVGGHNRAVAAALEREGRHDVVASMRAAGLLDQRRPVTTMMVPRWFHDAAPVARHRRVAQLVFEAWRSSDDGRSFKQALAERGLMLAEGDQVPVVVERAGIVWPLARLVGQCAYVMTGTWITAAVVEGRIATLALPSVAQARHNIAMADRFDDRDAAASSDHATAPATARADGDARLAGCATLIDNAAEEIVSAHFGGVDLQAWGDAALDEIVGLIDDAAAMLVDDDGQEALMVSAGRRMVSALDDGALDQIADLIDFAVEDMVSAPADEAAIKASGAESLDQVASLIDEAAAFSVSHDRGENAGLLRAADELLYGSVTTNDVRLRRDMTSVEPVSPGADPANSANSANPACLSVNAQDRAVEPTSVICTASSSSLCSTSSHPPLQTTRTKSDQPKEQNHDERTDQRQSEHHLGENTAGNGACDGEGNSAGNTNNAQDHERVPGKISADGKRHETHSGADRQDCGAFAGRADGRTPERRADAGGSGRADRMQSGIAHPFGRANTAAPATGAGARRSEQTSIGPKHNAAMVHQKKKPPVPQRSIWQTALRRARVEIGMMARAVAQAVGVSAATDRNRSDPSKLPVPEQAVSIQAARKNMAERSTRPAAKIIPPGAGVARYSGAPPVSGTSLAIGSLSLKPGTMHSGAHSAPPAVLPNQRGGATPAMRSDHHDGHDRTLTPVAAIGEAKPTAPLSKGPTDDSVQSTMSRPPARPLASKIAAHGAPPFEFRPSIAPRSPTIQKRVERTPEPDDEGPAPGM